MPRASAPTEMLLSDRPWVHRMLRAPIAARPFTSVVSITIQLVACLLLGWLLGGADNVAPHWYFLPIAFGALRFGVFGAFVTAMTAAVLAGPLTAADVHTGTIQPLGEQVSQLVAFVVIGVGVALLLERSVAVTRRHVSSMDLSDRVRAAIDHGDLTVEYQPLWRIDATGTTMIGVEALARWIDPHDGVMPPGVFVPLLEQADRMDEIGSWVLDQACQQLAAWEAGGLESDRPFHVAVNVSSLQIGDAFAEVVGTTLARHGVSAERLVLELTERTVLEDLAMAAPRLASIRDLGVRLAIDDFGTGFSSLAYLRRLDIDIVKLDRAFIGSLGTSSSDTEDTDATIVRSVVALLHDLDKVIVVEGVESGRQLERLCGLGATVFQGSHLGDPEDGTDIGERLEVERVHAEKPGSFVSGPSRRQSVRHDVAVWLRRAATPRHGRAPVDTRDPAHVILIGMFLAGSLLTCLAIVLSDGPNDGPVLGLGAAGIAGAVVVNRFRGRIDDWMLHVLLLAGHGIILTAIAVDPVPTTMVATSAFLIWVTIYAGAFFELRDAVAHGVLVGVAFGAILHFNPIENDAVVWIIIMGTAGVAGFVVGWFARQLRLLAATDPLTGLPNRQAFESQLRAEIDRAERSNAPLALALVDLDDFKSVNDTQGHHAGDRVLASLPAQWRQELRTHDVLARYGGDEFIVLLPDCPLDDAEDALTRMSRSGHPSCSVGVVTLAWGERPESLMARADAALYQAKAHRSVVRADRSVPSELAVGGPSRNDHPAGSGTS